MANMPSAREYEEEEFTTELKRRYTEDTEEKAHR